MVIYLNGNEIRCQRCLGQLYETNDPEDEPIACICGARFDKNLRMIGETDLKKFLKKHRLLTNGNKAFGKG